MLAVLRESIAGFIFPEMENRRNELERLVNFDELTGLANRRDFDKAERRARRERMAFILFDANNFGRVNKTAGHSHGDRVLKQFSDVIANVARNYKARAFRIGGDEFVIICSPRFAEKIRNSVETRALPVDFGNFIVTISGEIGVSVDDADSRLQARKAEKKRGNQ